MTLNEYQEKAMTTCMASSDNFAYMLTGLTAEVGEVNDKIAKAIRKGYISLNSNEIILNVSNREEFEKFNDGIMSEISDCVWFIAGLCKVFGLSLEDVCRYNLDKLASRKERNVIDGNGDNR